MEVEPTAPIIDAAAIEGYYQRGSGTHPGGCVTGGPGKLAATQVLADRSGL